MELFDAQSSGILYTVTQARIRENKLKVFTFASIVLNQLNHRYLLLGLLFWNEGFKITY